VVNTQPQAQQQISITDPDRVQECLVTGPFTINVTGPLATLVFTQLRPDPDALLHNRNSSPTTAVIRARIVMPTEGLLELKKVIEGMISPSPLGGVRQ
jgi:hypothetical protein